MIVELPDLNRVEPEPVAGADHPIRKLTRSLAFGGSWTEDDARKVGEVFDNHAPSWDTRHANPGRTASIEDALDRGNPPFDGRWLDVGSGTGVGTRLLDGKVREQVSVDLSAQMLAHAPDGIAPKVRADSSRLPFADDTFDAVLLINMLLFPNEIARVLRPTGALIWVNSLGDRTPIHLPPADVAAVLPGDWSGVSSNAGSGLWAVMRRD